MTTTITRAVIETDVRLEEEAAQCRQELAQHRWHWTLDESNPKRVSIREYARLIGRGETTVRGMVNAYAEWAARGAPRSEFGDYQARAHMGAETVAATEAVAKAKGISVESARRHHANEVRDVKAIAQEKVEAKGGTVSDAAEAVATNREKVRAADRKTKEDKKKAHTVRYIQAEGKIAVAMSNLRAVLKDTEGVEFTAEERELVAGALGQLRALLNLLDMRIVGTTDIDWDAEMAKLSDGAS